MCRHFVKQQSDHEQQPDAAIWLDLPGAAEQKVAAVVSVADVVFAL